MDPFRVSLHFKELMHSLVIIGFGIAAVTFGVVTAAGQSIGMSEVAFIVVSLVGDSVVATMLPTRVRVKPGAFLFGLLAVLFVTFLGGGVLGFTVSSLVDSVGSSSAASAAVKAVLTSIFAAAIAYVGVLGLDRLVRSFEFS